MEQIITFTNNKGEKVSIGKHAYDTMTSYMSDTSHMALLPCVCDERIYKGGAVRHGLTTLSLRGDVFHIDSPHFSGNVTMSLVGHNLHEKILIALCGNRVGKLLSSYGTWILEKSSMFVNNDKYFGKIEFATFSCFVFRKGEGGGYKKEFTIDINSGLVGYARNMPYEESYINLTYSNVMLFDVTNQLYARGYRLIMIEDAGSVQVAGKSGLEYFVKFSYVDGKIEFVGNPVQIPSDYEKS